MTPTSHDVKLLSVVYKPDKGVYRNMDHMMFICDLFKKNRYHFTNDYMADLTNDDEVAQFILDYIETLNGWFFIVNVDDKPSGLIWAENWKSFGRKIYSVEISGVACRGVRIFDTSSAIKELSKEIFKRTDCYVVRSVFEESNTPARLAVKRSGFKALDSLTAHHLRDGAECTAIIASITRPDYEATVNGQS